MPGQSRSMQPRSSGVVGRAGIFDRQTRRRAGGVFWAQVNDDATQRPGWVRPSGQRSGRAIIATLAPTDRPGAGHSARKRYNQLFESITQCAVKSTQRWPLSQSVRPTPSVPPSMYYQRPTGHWLQNDDDDDANQPDTRQQHHTCRYRVGQKPGARF